jgi:histidinol phosphatase-like PHP family hydrolase
LKASGLSERSGSLTSPVSKGNKRLKLDLHTHCGEATSLYTPTVDIVKQIVAAARAKGLDGIAVTEHNNRAYGYKVKQIVEQQLHEDILIIPGQEIDRGPLHIVVLYLPGDTTFRFVGHPGYPPVKDLAAEIDDSIQGLEIRNPTHDDEIDEALVTRIARERGLLLLRNSDAHFLSDIGKYYTEIELDELCARARQTRHSQL